MSFLLSSLQVLRNPPCYRNSESHVPANQIHQFFLLTEFRRPEVGLPH